MTLEQRVAKLERQNRWLRRGGAVVVAFVATVFLIAQGEAEDKDLPDLVGKSLVLRGADGFPWLVAVPGDTGGKLAMHSRNPGARLELNAEKQQVELLFFTKDTRHWPRAMIGTNHKGRPHMTLWGTGYNLLAGVYEHTDGHGWITLCDKKQRLIWRAPPWAPVPLGGVGEEEKGEAPK